MTTTNMHDICALTETKTMTKINILDQNQIKMIANISRLYKTMTKMKRLTKNTAHIRLYITTVNLMQCM